MPTSGSEERRPAKPHPAVRAVVSEDISGLSTALPSEAVMRNAANEAGKDDWTEGGESFTYQGLGEVFLTTDMNPTKFCEPLEEGESLSLVQ